MTKSEFVSLFAERQGVSKNLAKLFVDSFFEIITEKLEGGEKEIKFTPWLSFELVDKEAHTGRNPMTGESIEVEARRVVKIKKLKKLKEVC